MHAVRPDIAGNMGAYGAALLARDRYRKQVAALGSGNDQAELNPGQAKESTAEKVEAADALNSDQAEAAGERSEGCEDSERSSTAAAAVPQVESASDQVSSASAGRSEGCEASERSSADGAIAVPQTESNNDQAAGSAAWSEGCAASERNASEAVAAPQVDAVPQANQEEEDEDALWV